MNPKSFFLWNGPRILGILGGILVGAAVDGFIALVLAGIFSLFGAPLLLTFGVLFTLLFGWGCINMTIRIVHQARMLRAEREAREREEAAEARRVEELRFLRAKRVN